MESSITPPVQATAGLPPGTVVLQVLPAMANGGVERGTIEIADAIVRAGGRALVASAGGANLGRLERVGAEHFAMPLAAKTPWTILANRRRLRRLIEDERVSIVHARSRAPAWAAGPAARAAGVPFVTTYHGSYNEGSWLKKLYNRIMVSSDRVIAISTFIAELIRQRYGTPASRVCVIHRGADLNVFNPAAVGPGRLLKLQNDWGIREDTRVVLLPGRLTRWKGQGVLIEAFAALKARGTIADVTVVLAGDAEGRTGYQRELERLCRKHRFSGREIVFAGQCNDMPAAIMLADVVVSASVEPEAFGRVMAESGAMGKPVIASSIGAAPEIVVPGETGWLVLPGDADALADALKDALSLSEEQRAAMRDAALARVRERFSVEAMCAKTLTVYNDLLAR